MKASAGEKQSRIKELDELLRMAQYYVDGKPVADKLGSIRFEKSRQKYKSEHDDTLRTFYMDQLSFFRRHFYIFCNIPIGVGCLNHKGRKKLAGSRRFLQSLH